MSEFPLRMGSEAAFAAARAYLRDSGYSLAFLLDRLGVADLHSVLFPYGLRREALDARYRGEGMEAARVLLGGYEGSLPAAFEELGVVQGGRAPVVVYPSHGFFVAADRPMYADGSRAYQGSDYVMSGAEALCRMYVDSLPTSPCRRFLDVGCGSGLAALTASRVAEQVWATDITGRAAAFAEFNRRLNGVENMTVLTGDLFAPAPGMTFDRIAANPPFEPPLKQNLIFSVGGEDGEAILARLIAEAPAHLEPGGRLYCLVSGTDRLHEAFDERVRRWLGAASEECDVALFVRQKLTPREYAIEQILGDNADAWKIEEWSRFYQKLEAVRVIVGHLVVQRRASDRAVFHVRQDLGERAVVGDMEWLVDWETRCAESLDSLREWRPLAAEGWQLHVRHDFADGGLALRELVLKQSHPFAVELTCGESLPQVLCRCDGSHTTAELFAWLGGTEDAFPGFLRSLADLVSAGFLKRM